MNTHGRDILETLSRSGAELHPRLLEFLALRLEFVDSFSGSHVDPTSIPQSYIESVDSLKDFLSEDYDDRSDWLTRWWCPYMLPDFVGVLFECTFISQSYVYVKILWF